MFALALQVKAVSPSQLPQPMLGDDGTLASALEDLRLWTNERRARYAAYEVILDRIAYVEARRQGAIDAATSEASARIDAELAPLIDEEERLSAAIVEAGEAEIAWTAEVQRRQDAGAAA